MQAPRGQHQRERRRKGEGGISNLTGTRWKPSAVEGWEGRSGRVEWRCRGEREGSEAVELSDGSNEDEQSKHTHKDS